MSDSLKHRKQKRINERIQQIRRDAIRSRRFSQQEFTKLGVEFILSGLKISKNRGKILDSVKNKDDQ